uniref:Uncharacterized protein n=1 Tax=Anguilla anguilla TaxID=7936 RepID=A0A0E9UCQ9_ANGAN
MFTGLHPFHLSHEVFETLFCLLNHLSIRCVLLFGNGVSHSDTLR